MVREISSSGLRIPIQINIMGFEEHINILSGPESLGTTVLTTVNRSGVFESNMRLRGDFDFCTAKIATRNWCD